jgi:hypothetical protein
MAVLRRVKVKAGHYDMVALDEVVATVVKTGTHLDDYPWDWYLADGWTNYQGRTTGTTDSLANAVDIVQHLWVAGHIERE